MDLSEETKQAVRTALAAQALATMTPDAKNEILSRSITEALKCYSYADSVKDAVQGKLKECAAAYIQSEEGAAVIDGAFRKGLALFLDKLPEAVAATMTEAFFGHESTGAYDSSKPGILLKHLRKISA